MSKNGTDERITITNGERDPWERQEGEGAKAFGAFWVYCELGINRTHRKVSIALGKSETLISRWASNYRWKERAAKWDDEQIRIARESQLEEIKKMRKRHADLANKMLIKAEKALQRIQEDDIKVQDISRMVETASKLERLSRGDVGEVIEERSGGDAVSSVQFYIPDNSRDKSKGDE